MYRADSMAPLPKQGALPFGGLRHYVSLPWSENPEASLVMHDLFKKQVLAQQGVHEVRSVADINRHDSMGILFGTHAPEYTDPRQLSRTLREMHKRGIRTVFIVRNGRNEYGSAYDAEGGLTKYGEIFVELCGEAKIIIDVSYANHETTMDILHVAGKNFISRQNRSWVMASHTGCYSVFSHRRNIRDEALAGLYFFDGYVGIFAASSFIARPSDTHLKEYIRHIGHAIRMCNGTHIVGTTSWGVDVFEILEMSLQEHFRSKALHDLCGISFKKFLERALPET